MNGMWQQWAQRRRLLAVVYLGGSAVAFAAAFCLWAIGGGWFVGIPLVLGAAVLVLAGFALYDAHRYAKQVS